MSLALFSNPGLSSGWWRHCFLLQDREANFAERGFKSAEPTVQHRLETIGKTFIAGYNTGLLSDEVASPLSSVANIAPDLRGFMAEGIAMGAAIADALTLTRRRLPLWIAASEAHFTYLTHVGAGWALARVPFWRRAILGSLDPIHRWLAFDGLGFHDGYFFPSRVLSGWRRVRRGYEPMAYDQGIGRALWFVGGADVRWISEQIGCLPRERRSHLWSGLGLAICYAGGASDTDLQNIARLAGRFNANLRQGVAFAAAAHVQAKHVPPHTRQVVRALTGLDAQEAADLVHTARAKLPTQDAGTVPRYELWREDVRRSLATEVVEMA
jgi:hypothetical protein